MDDTSKQKPLRNPLQASKAAPVTDADHRLDAIDPDGGAAVTQALEGARVIETWDDLLDLTEDEPILVALPSRLGQAVWVWHKTLDHTNPAGEMGRGVRDILLGLHENRVVQILEGVVGVMKGLAKLRAS